MPAYHSAFNTGEAESAQVCGLSMLPLKTRVRGPAPCIEASAAGEDAVDEALRLFRANVLFRNFEVQGAGDRTLIYLTLLIHQFIKKAEKAASKAEALHILAPIAASAHHMPGEPGWPLGPLIAQPRSVAEGDALKGYLKQLREALAPRLLERIFNADGTPNKFWMMFSKRKFLNKEFPVA